MFDVVTGVLLFRSAGTFDIVLVTRQIFRLDFRAYLFIVASAGCDRSFSGFRGDAVDEEDRFCTIDPTSRGHLCCLVVI